MQQPSSENLKIYGGTNKRAAIALSALAIGAGVGSLGSESAEATTANKSYESQSQESLKQITDKQLSEIHSDISAMFKKEIKLAYSASRETIDYKGRKLIRRILTFGDTIFGTTQKSYTHIVEYFEPGQVLPESLQIIRGARSQTLDESDFEYATTLSRNPNDSDNYVLAHHGKNNNQNIIKNFYVSNPPKFLFDDGKSGPAPASKNHIRDVFNNFTAEASGLLKYFEQKNNKDNPLVA